MIDLKTPVYYWSDYWHKWDEIIGWNPLNQYIVVREVGKEFCREHCTTMNKQHISLSVISRNDFDKYNKFIEKVIEESGKAWNTLMKNGIPKYIQRRWK